MPPATRHQPPATSHPLDKYDAPSLLGNQARRRFHVMVKPGGSTCNLDCSYCFYLSKETLPGGPATGPDVRRNAGAVHLSNTSPA